MKSFYFPLSHKPIKALRLVEERGKTEFSQSNLTLRLIMMIKQIICYNRLLNPLILL
ncbi:MAG: hypothetical protein Q8O10_05675 [candidate division Zixibacteria bacterium]|nr:hypothetical protein [candidate division Zixibacteria bacterium]